MKAIALHTTIAELQQRISQLEAQATEHEREIATHVSSIEANNKSAQMQQTRYESGDSSRDVLSVSCRD